MNKSSEPHKDLQEYKPTAFFAVLQFFLSFLPDDWFRRVHVPDEIRFRGIFDQKAIAWRKAAFTWNDLPLSEMPPEIADKVLEDYCEFLRVEERRLTRLRSEAQRLYSEGGPARLRRKTEAFLRPSWEAGEPS